MLAPGMAATGMEATQRLPATVTFSQTATAIMILGLPRASKSIAHKINFLLNFLELQNPKCPCCALCFTGFLNRGLSPQLV